MTRPQDSEFHAKTDSFESFLAQLNQTLEPVFGEPPPPVEVHATAQITGLPRSGTTVLYQLLARTRVVGYVSNVMAMFWQVPVVGAQIQRSLARTRPTLSTRSLAGRTPEPLDPHEFGYFWRAALGHTSNTVVRDLEPWPSPRLQVALDAVTGVFESPTVYKNFLVLPHVDEMRAGLSDVRFLAASRSVEEVAASLIVLRRTLADAAPPTLGLQPVADHVGTERGSVPAIAHQVTELHHLYKRARFGASADSMEIPYEDLCRAPREVVEAALRFVGADFPTGSLDELPVTLERRRAVDLLTPSERRELDSALAPAHTENHD